MLYRVAEQNECGICLDSLLYVSHQGFKLLWDVTDFCSVAVLFMAELSLDLSTSLKWKQE